MGGAAVTLGSPHADGRRHSSAAPHSSSRRSKCHQRQRVRPGDVLSTRKDSVSRSGIRMPRAGSCCATLAFADVDQRPDHRLRTLTGAGASPGTRASGLFARRAGGRTSRRLPPWRRPAVPMPLWMGYDDELAADRRPQQRRGPGLAGAIFGALFLTLRDRDGHWLHLDLSPGIPRSVRAGVGPRRTRSASTAIYCNATVRCDHEKENQGSRRQAPSRRVRRSRRYPAVSRA